MEEQVLRNFYFEILLQSKFAMWAYDQTGKYASMKRKNQHTFYHIQAFLVACGNISKIVYPVKWHKDTKLDQQRKEERSRVLRKNLSIDDGWILKDRIFRDHFEHYDERIEEWFNDQKSVAYADWHVGTFAELKRALPHVEEKNVWRHYDPTTETLMFRGEKYELKPAVWETKRLYDIISPIIHAD